MIAQRYSNNLPFHLSSNNFESFLLSVGKNKLKVNCVALFNYRNFPRTLYEFQEKATRFIGISAELLDKL